MKIKNYYNKNRITFGSKTTQKDLKSQRIATNPVAVTKGRMNLQQLNIEGIDSFELKLINEKFGINAAEKSYRAIAEDNNISFHNARRKIDSALTKIKINNRSQVPEIEEFIKKFRSMFDCSEIKDSEILKAIQQQPFILEMNDKKLEENFKTILESFKKEGLNEQALLKAAIKKPNLFYQNPQTIINNINLLVNKFANEGLSTEAYLKAALKQPSLFYQKPETIEKNIRNTVAIFAQDGLTTEKYLKAALKEHALFTMLPETIKNKINGVVQRFAQEGLTVKDYIKAATKHGTLFILSPEKIEYNIRTLVNAFKNDGLQVKDYLKTALSQPNLFCQSPDTITKHISIIKFITKNKAYSSGLTNISDKEIMESVMRNVLAYSEKHLYTDLLNIKLSEARGQKRFDKNGLESKISKFIEENKNKVFSFSIVKDECTKEFIKFVSDFSIANAGKNIFKIKVV